MTTVIGGLALLIVLDEYAALRRHRDLERFALRALFVLVLAAGVFLFLVQIRPAAFR